MPAIELWESPEILRYGVWLIGQGKKDTLFGLVLRPYPLNAISLDMFLSLQRLLIFSMLTLATVSGFSAQPSISEDLALLESTLKKYQMSPLVEMSVEKKEISTLMGREKSHLGTVAISKQNFRWETSAPEKALVVFDGKTLWSVQYPSEKLKSSIQVTKSKITAEMRQQVLLSLLLGGEDLNKNFKIDRLEDSKGAAVFQLAPKAKSLKVTDLKIFVSEKSKTVSKISYLDEVENQTEWTFSQIVFKNKKNSKLFKFKVPQGAQVTEL